MELEIPNDSAVLVVHADGTHNVYVPEQPAGDAALPQSVDTMLCVHMLLTDALLDAVHNHCRDGLDDAYVRQAPEAARGRDSAPADAGSTQGGATGSTGTVAGAGIESRQDKRCAPSVGAAAE